jgi:transcriptional regulator with XRE-family HTH domain
MLFGDPHISKAIQLKRKATGLAQKRLAELIGVEPTTMSKFESGKHIPEDKLEKIAQATRCAVIDIMDMAYAIYRFNYCRIESLRTGGDLETVIARHDRRAVLERYRAAHAEYDEKRRELERQEIELKFLEKGDDFTVLREIVETEEEANPPASPKKKKS